MIDSVIYGKKDVQADRQAVRSRRRFSEVQGPQ